ncbi:MAG: membrane-associated protease RseP (regulator of RpoE activity), partial [Planctomycetota bacterium]
TPDTSGGIPLIGVGQPIKSDAAGNPVVGVQEGSPAWIAGLRNGDTLLSFVDPIPGVSLWDEFRERITEGQTLRLRVIGEDGDRVIEFDARKLEIDPNASPLIGVRPPLRSVGAVRQGSKLPLDLREGDRILSINGQRILRLGDYHRVIQDLTDAVAMGIERPLAGGVDTGILAGHPGWEQLVLSSPPLDSVGRQALIDDVAMTLDLESGIVVPQNGRVAAEIGLLDGDLVRSVDGVRIASWTELTNAIGIAGKESRAAAFEVTRLDNAGAPTDLVFQVQGRPTAATEHGVEILPDEYLFRTDGFIASIEAGTTFSWRFLQNTWLTLKRIILGSVRARDAIGGPVSIATISYRVAEQGLAKLFFFLCMLSINLAFLNILPIPILDGGHLFFLLVEKVKGSPVSDRVLGYSQLIGIVLILSLFVFVTYNDLARWVFN